MKEIRSKMMSLLDMAAIQMKEVVNDFNDIVNDIDWDGYLTEMNEKKEALLAKGAALLEDAKALFDEAKDCLCDFEVNIPFDKAKGETIEYEVNDGVLTVVVSYEDENENYVHKKKAIIPSGCDADSITMEVDETAKIAHFSVPRVEPTPQPSEENEEEESSSIKSILSRKLKENMKKSQERFNRDAMGRFARMEESEDPLPQQSGDED